MSTRTTPRGRASAGSRGRAGAAAGSSARFGRTSAPTGGRFGRSQPQAGRFGRSMTLQQSSTRRSPGSQTRGLPMMHRRSRAKKTGLAGALSALTNALPTGGAASAAKRGGGKPAGLALAAAAAGMAFKNRGKLAGMVGRGNRSQPEPMVPVQPQASPAPPAI